MTKTCLEVALNGPWSQERQPGMPITTEALIAEGIACADLGAAVIHVHVYNPNTGRQFEDFDAYRAVIEGIRAEKDVIVYPTRLWPDQPMRPPR
ncbi:3-keto-5-aminohexanoate cleavage protein [Rhodobacteraceae bacterium D3-12]|nr:3-keto-5-aminohexanoate cleavage protein [Rhodobacteraceae bacterium D3-12]